MQGHRSRHMSGRLLYEQPDFCVCLCISIHVYDVHIYMCIYDFSFIYVILRVYIYIYVLVHGYRQLLLFSELGCCCSVRLMRHGQRHRIEVYWTTNRVSVRIKGGSVVWSMGLQNLKVGVLLANDVVSWMWFYVYIYISQVCIYIYIYCGIYTYVRRPCVAG